MQNILKSIYARMKKIFIKKIITFSNDENISLSEIIMAEYICLNSGITIKEMANEFNLSPSNINYKLEVLLKHNLIKKEKSSKDKREFYLYPSEEYIHINQREERYIKSLNSRLKFKFTKEKYEVLKEQIAEIEDEII